MWEDEYFEFHGKYLDFPRRMVTPKPVQDPHPPCWMAATSDGSAAVAGKLGLGLLSFSILQPIQKMAQAHRSSTARQRPSPTPITRVTTNKVAAYTLVHCAETMEQARRTASGTRCGGGTRTSPSSPSSGSSRTCTQEEQDQIFPLLKRQLEGDFDPKVFTTPT